MGTDWFGSGEKLAGELDDVCVRDQIARMAAGAGYKCAKAGRELGDISVFVSVLPLPGTPSVCVKLLAADEDTDGD